MVEEHPQSKLIINQPFHTYKYGTIDKRKDYKDGIQRSCARLKSGLKDLGAGVEVLTLGLGSSLSGIIWAHLRDKPLLPFMVCPQCSI